MPVLKRNQNWMAELESDAGGLAGAGTLVKAIGTAYDRAQ